MPGKITATLLPQRELKRENLTNDKLHGLFFSLIEGDLARDLHSNKSVQPFSLRFFATTDGKRKDLLSVKDGSEIERIHIEISFLDDSLLPKFLSSYVLTNNDTLHIDNIPLRKLKKPRVNEKDFVSYRSLIEKGESLPPKYCIDFLTPTLFKRGQGYAPFPQPDLVLRSLIRKWQRFSDIKIDINLTNAMNNELFVTGLKIKTVKVNLSSFGWVAGFTGRVYFRILSEDPKVRKWISALFLYSEFSGIGSKTTMGFGRVRLVDPFPEEE